VPRELQILGHSVDMQRLARLELPEEKLVRANAGFAMFSLVAGTILGVLLLAGLTPSYKWLTVVFFLWGLASFFLVRTSRLSLLPRLAILAYLAAFLPLIKYVVDGPYMWRPRPHAFFLFSDELLISQMVLIGAVGLFGLVGGIGLTRIPATLPIDNSNPVMESPRRTLDLLAFSLVIGVALFLSLIGTPSTTIFDSLYIGTGTGTIAALTNFRSSSLASYMLLILLWIDREREAKSALRRGKTLSLIIVIVIVVMIFGLLRGNRDSIGLVIGITALYLTEPHTFSLGNRISPKVWRRIRVILFPSVIILFVFVSVGGARSRLASQSLTTSDLGEFFISGIETGSWGGVLTTNLGAAAEYRYGSIHYLNGQTYADYLKSLPPGIVTRSLGLTRPLEVDRGPSWWFSDISNGGIHLAVVPFKNFGVFGVLAVVGVYGFLIGNVDRRGEKDRFWSRLIYAAFAVVITRWFLYGDMVLLRGLILIFLAGYAYRFWLQMVSRFALTTR
jgi:hypothetical protein